MNDINKNWEEINISIWILNDWIGNKKNYFLKIYFFKFLTGFQLLCRNYSNPIVLKLKQRRSHLYNVSQEIILNFISNKYEDSCKYRVYLIKTKY